LKLETISCPLCGAHPSASRPWGEENGFTAVQCTECALVYVNPRPSRQEITEANVIGQHRTEDGTLDVVFDRKPSRIGHYRRIIKSLFSERFREPVAWLDVGAGFGEVVEAVRSLAVAGSRVEGIEPIQAKTRVAQDLGLSIRACPLSEVTERYDVVSIINVLSHIPDFREFLAVIRDHLNVGGELLVQTGNGGDLASADQYPDQLYLPDHLVFAGVDHVRRFLMQGGLELTAIREVRVDGFVNAAKNAVHRLTGKRAPLFLPYTSPFRTVFYKARLTN